MTTDENFKIVKEIETKNAKKELIKKEKNKIKHQAVNCVTWNLYQLTARLVKIKIFVQRSLRRNQSHLGTV